jgi:hypothetical protein
MTTAAVLAAITTMLPIAVSTTHAASTADDSAHIAAAVSTDHRPEPLQLSCEARLSDDVAGARCAWSAPTSDAAAGVELVRVAIGSDQGRQVVFRTTDLSVTEHVDTPIRAGVRYAYAVIAVNNVGRIVGRSRTVVTGVPAAEPPSVELLQLHCRAGSSEPTERNRVGCEWTLPTSPARALTLWHSVNDGARERVALFSTPFAASYGDVVSAGTTSVVYVVIATDGDGQVVASSRASCVDIVASPTTGPTRSTTVEPVPVRSGSVAQPTPATTTVPNTTRSNSAHTVQITGATKVAALPAAGNSGADRSSVDVVRTVRGASD